MDKKWINPYANRGWVYEHLGGESISRLEKIGTTGFEPATPTTPTGFQTILLYQIYNFL